MDADSLRAAIQQKIDQGDEYLDEDEFGKAIACFQEAVSLLPRPEHRHEMALAAFTALGEGYFFSGYHPDAIKALKEAQKAPGGVENAFLYLRLGQAYFENGEMDLAADSLTRAYALDGRKVFKGEDKKYLSFLATRIEL